MPAPEGFEAGGAPHPSDVVPLAVALTPQVEDPVVAEVGNQTEAGVIPRGAHTPRLRLLRLKNKRCTMLRHRSDTEARVTGKKGKRFGFMGTTEG